VLWGGRKRDVRERERERDGSEGLPCWRLFESQ
jgi:hypothetical protein